MAAKEITQDDMMTLRKVLKGDDEMSIVKTMQRLNLDFEDKVQSFSRLFEFCLHLHDSDNITFVAWNFVLWNVLLRTQNLKASAYNIYRYSNVSSSSKLWVDQPPVFIITYANYWQI